MGARAVQAPEPEPVKQSRNGAGARQAGDDAARSEVEAAAAAEERAKRSGREDACQPALSRRKAPPKRRRRVRGQGFGLSSAGGGGAGGVTVDAVNFCCPDYITTMAELVKQDWNGNQGRTDVTTMKFTILKDGVIEGIQVEKPSGFPPLDNEAARALRVVRLPPLPPRYHEPDAHRSSGIRVREVRTGTDMNTLARAPRSGPGTIAIAAALLAAGIVAAQQPPQQPAGPAPQQPSEIATRIDTGSGCAASLRGSRLHRADAECRRDGADARAGALGRPELRARVRHDSARRLQVRSGGALSRTGPVRGVARDRRRWRVLRHSRADGERCADFRPAVQRPHAGRRCSARNTPSRRGAPGGSPMKWRTRFTRINAVCAAWRERDWRLCPIASGSRCLARSKSGSSRRCTWSDYDGANELRITNSRDLNLNPTWSNDAPRRSPIPRIVAAARRTSCCRSSTPECCRT